jgi:subfamily B ATP-binding cassette protein MsbA
MKQSDRQSSRVLYRRLLRYILPFWPMFVAAIVGNILYSGVDAWFVHFVQPLLNKGFIGRDLAFLRWLPVIILSAFAIRAFSNVCAGYCMAYVSRGVIMRLRSQLFQTFQTIPASLYDQSSRGRLLSKMIYDVEQVANAGADTLTTFLKSIVLVVGLLGVMFAISWKLSLVYFATLPFIVLLVKYVSQRMRRLSVAIQQSMGTITSMSEDNVSGYQLVRMFAAQTYERDRFDKVLYENRRNEMKVALTKCVGGSGVQLLAAVALAIIISFAASSTHMGLTAGAFTSLITAMLAILKPMKDLTNLNGTIQKGLAAAGSVFALLDEPRERDQGQCRLLQAKGLLEVKDLCFRYRDNGADVLRDISFVLKPAKMLALVGRSGSGKSSLMNVLLRFYDYERGQISLDGVAIQDYVLADYRRQIAYVSQDVVLFNDTVLNNCRYGQAELSLEQCRQAAKAAHALSFIEALPQGFDTMIGDRGVLLSGGQRQRLALTRAILKKAPLLILDEATSALDTESERYVQEALTQLMHQCTTLVIAHRLSTVQQADEILVMDRGQVVEQGKHEELLAMKGYYAKLYAMQFNA